MTLPLFQLEHPLLEKDDSQDNEQLADIEREDQSLKQHFQTQIQNDPSLSRQAVSFQVSKNLPQYRWFKFKEAFSPSLVQSLLEGLTPGRLLDPFAGSGTSLFAGAGLGWSADGIEVLPIGRQIITTRLMIEREFTLQDWERLIYWKNEKPWQKAAFSEKINSMRITEGAYPQETLDAMEKYSAMCSLESERVAIVLRFVLLCVLESMSYTRKDGQYLRWDYRSSRRQGSKPFNKGTILKFDQALTEKMEQILEDVYQPSRLVDVPIVPTTRNSGAINIWAGSCLDLLPQFESCSYDAIMTSPPYCNRYDYTRTYALELALLDVTGEELIGLRQTMLTCTVENRAKDLLALNPAWRQAIDVADGCVLLQRILAYLDQQKEAGLLNNAGIARMVRGYFYEMACVIQECARVLTAGSYFWLVNDNVRYSGASISVDLILSYFAESLGFEVEKIAVLPGNKGNSSQQMGQHGREPLRKCVYIWKKL